MRKLLFLICALEMSCVAWAQSNPASWKNLNMLQAGDKIQVVETSSKKISGTFLSVSNQAISLQGKTRSGHYSHGRCLGSVKLMVAQHRLRNTLIGAGVGAGAGAGVGAATSCSSGQCYFGKGAGIGIGAAIGALPGALVGALFPTHNTIYP